jgi:hypothetical protein
MSKILNDNNGNEDEQQNCNAQTIRARDYCCSQASSRRQGKASKAKIRGGCRAGRQVAHPSTFNVGAGNCSTFAPRSREHFAD